MHETPDIFPTLDLMPLTAEQVGSRLSEDELTLHNELAVELQAEAVPNSDARWEHYHFLHTKGLGLDQQEAA